MAYRGHLRSVIQRRMSVSHDYSCNLSLNLCHFTLGFHLRHQFAAAAEIFPSERPTQNPAHHQSPDSLSATDFC